MTDLVEHCYAQGWTDGLPVVAPTRERVRAMLGDRIDHADDVVAVLHPSRGVATLEKVAANAVMAGCLPEHLPVVEAAVRAVADPAFNLDRVMTTASSQTPVVLVSGPVAAAVGMSGSWEALGSRARANATIGRALLLVLRNVASHSVGGLDHATLGHAGKYSFCITENVEASPWAPWHVDRGAAADTSVVAVFPAEAPLVIADMGHDTPEAVLRTLGESIAIPGTYNAYFRQDLWVVLSPQHARIFAAAGWSRHDVAEGIFERARLPVGRLRGRGLYGYMDDLLPATWLEGLADDDTVAVVDDVSRLVVLVAGGEFGGYTAALFGEGVTVTETVSAGSAGVSPAGSTPPTGSSPLVDPTAERRAERPPAEGLEAGSRPNVGLVDGTLNKASMWGRGMLDAAAAAISDVFPGASFGWESLDPLANEPPERWAAAMTSRYDALVVTAGDCVTCTTRGVRDAIWADSAGTPAAVVCTGAVDEVVQRVCQTFGMAALPVCRVETSLFGLSRAEIAARTAPFVGDLGTMLRRRPRS